MNLRALGAIALVAACEGAGSPAGVAEKAIAFTVQAPGSVPTKQVVDIEVRVTRASLLNYPLTVTFEEANRGEPFVLVASVLLRKPEDIVARIREEAARDPQYRVTIREAGGDAVLSAVRIVHVDVLDFP